MPEPLVPVNAHFRIAAMRSCADRMAPMHPRLHTSPALPASLHRSMARVLHTLSPQATPTPKLGPRGRASAPQQILWDFRLYVQSIYPVGSVGLYVSGEEGLTLLVGCERVGEDETGVAMKLEGFVDVSTVLRAGVYALCWRGEVVYVGKSKSVLGRVYTHRSAARRKEFPSWLPIKGVQFDEFHVIPCRPDQLDAVEREMIDRYRPRHNVHLKPPATEPIKAEIALTIGSTQIRLNAKQPLARRI